jgi:3-dehydroquinate dehydratase-2
MKILVIHGPNLNMLGKREPEVYGTRTLEEINALITSHAKSKGATVSTFQSNHEGAIIDHIQLAAAEGHQAIVINPGAYTHTSLAIGDAIRGVDLPVIEVHISNIHAREEARARSLTAPACIGSISGFGFNSYLLGVDAAIAVLKS